MELSFVNRAAELAELDAFARNGGLMVVFGRRRVGKTRLLRRWLDARRGLYSQALEAGKQQQLEQVFADVSPGLSTQLAPRTWVDFFELLDLQPRAPLLCLDEFPYLVAADPSLPSVVQRWLDHRKHKSALLVLSGSSTRMMNETFLNRGAPLFGRAHKLLHLLPMGYRAFARACRLNPAASDTFVRYALVGGVPRYWELVEPRQSPAELAEALFFRNASFLEFEPARLLKDEGVTGTTAISVLEAVGRGAERPSEIAARLNTPQTNLSRPFQVLLDAGLLSRELPWGESLRTTRRTVYRLKDPTLRFWFRVFSPHRSRWATYGRAERARLLELHASAVFEDSLRALWPDAARYWEPGLELDSVREEDGRLVVTEIKWKSLSKGERLGCLENLARRFSGSRLAAREPRPRFEVLDTSALRLLRRDGSS